MAMTAVTPTTIPSVVRMERSRLARRARKAAAMLSRISMRKRVTCMSLSALFREVPVSCHATVAA